jgi:hypothetical protein
MSHLEGCQVSIHDLSRVGRPARFNMPFELGLAYAVRRYCPARRRRSLILLETAPHRLSRTLSDMAGYDPGVHQGKPRRIISCILDSLGTGESDPSPERVYRLWKQLMKASRQLKAAAGRDDVYSRSLFKRLTTASIELAVRAGFILR